MKTAYFKTATAILLLFWSYIIRAQGNTGGILTPIKEGVEKLEVKNHAQVEIHSSTDGKTGYEVQGKAENYKVSFSGTTMEVDYDGASSDKEKVIIYYNGFSSVNVKDVAWAEFNNLKAGEMTLKSQDKSGINGSLYVNTLNILAHDASTINLSGTVTDLAITAKDAAGVHVEEMNAVNATVIASDASNTYLKTSTKLDINAKDLSRVTYTGVPSGNFNVQVTDLAKVKEVSDNDGDPQVVIKGSGGNDTVRIRLGSRKVIIYENPETPWENPKRIKPKKHMKKVYAGFELGVNSFVTPSFSFEQDEQYSFMENNIGKSWFYGLNLFEGDLHLVRNKVALTSGFGMEWSNFRFKGDEYIAPGRDSLQAITSPLTLTNNRLQTFNLNVPLLLKIAPGGNKGFHMAFGAIFTYTPGVKYKMETNDNGFKQKTKTKDDLNVNPFRVTGTVRVGYGWFRAFASYSLTPYFSKNAGPDIRNFSAGIILIPFG